MQVMVSEMLSAWGPAGFERHICSMQREYAQRAAVIQAGAEQHLTGLAEWTRPAAGMFLWLKLLVVSDADEVLDKLKDAGVVVVPGTVATPQVKSLTCTGCLHILCLHSEVLGCVNAHDAICQRRCIYTISECYASGNDRLALKHLAAAVRGTCCMIL